MPELDQDLDRKVHHPLHELGAAAMDRWVAWLQHTQRNLNEGKPIR
ncbi:hypothetical protein [Streptomyces sp. AcE210]|nr:hypothetical protein [Streptomyces sp. AcE210]